MSTTTGNINLQPRWYWSVISHFYATGLIHNDGERDWLSLASSGTESLHVPCHSSQMVTDHNGADGRTARSITEPAVG